MLIAPTKEQVQLISDFVGMSSSVAMPYAKLFRIGHPTQLSNTKNIVLKDLFESLQEAGIVPHGVNVPTITADDVQVMEIVPAYIGASKPIEASEAYAHITSVGSPSTSPRNVMDEVIMQKMLVINNASNRTKENIAKALFLDGIYTNTDTNIKYDLGLSAVIAETTASGTYIEKIASMVETFVNTYSRNAKVGVGKTIFNLLKQEINAGAGRKNENRGTYTSEMKDGVFYITLDALNFEIMLLPNTYSVSTYDTRVQIWADENLIETYGAIPFRGQNNVMGLLRSEVYVDVSPSVDKENPEDKIFSKSAYVPLVIDPQLFKRYDLTTA